jgi:hypothetical protein
MIPCVRLRTHRLRHLCSSRATALRNSDNSIDGEQPHTLSSRVNTHKHFPCQHTTPSAPLRASLTTVQHPTSNTGSVNPPAHHHDPCRPVCRIHARSISQQRVAGSLQRSVSRHDDAIMRAASCVRCGWEPESVPQREQSPVSPGG